MLNLPGSRCISEIGAANDVIEVGFEIADSPNFRNIVRRGAIATVPESAIALMLTLGGWRQTLNTTTDGRSATPLARWGDQDCPCRVNRQSDTSSCQQYKHHFYTAYQHMAEEEMDLIVHLGDYIYERSWGQNLVRHHEGAEIITLDDAIATSPTRAILTSRQHTPLKIG